ncbi:MAG: hypothetical protein Q9188_007414 [Gyalolechia gomerana]
MNVEPVQQKFDGSFMPLSALGSSLPSSSEYHVQLDQMICDRRDTVVSHRHLSSSFRDLLFIDWNVQSTNTPWHIRRAALAMSEHLPEHLQQLNTLGVSFVGKLGQWMDIMTELLLDRPKPNSLTCQIRALQLPSYGAAQVARKEMLDEEEEVRQLRERCQTMNEACRTLIQRLVRGQLQAALQAWSTLSCAIPIDLVNEGGSSRERGEIARDCCSLFNGLLGFN